MVGPVAVPAALAIITVAAALLARRGAHAWAVPLRRTGFWFAIAYGLFATVFIAGEAFSDPGGTRGAGLVLAWLAPLAALAALAWYRPAAACVVLGGAVAAVLALAAWYALDPAAWRSFEDHAGPVRAIASFVLTVALGVLGRQRTTVAGTLLILLGAGPVVLADMAGVGSMVGLSASLAGVPAVLIGGLYLASGVSRGAPRSVRPSGTYGPHHRSGAP